MRASLLVVAFLMGCGGGSNDGTLPADAVGESVSEETASPTGDAEEAREGDDSVVGGETASDQQVEPEITVMPWVPSEPVDAEVVASKVEVGKVEGLAFDGVGGLFLTGSNGDIVKVAADGSSEVVGSIPKVDGFATPNLAGAAWDARWGLLVLQYSGDRLCRYTQEGGVEVVRSDLAKGPNGMVVGSDGSIYVSLSESGKVVRMSEPGGEMELVAEGLSFPNGLAQRGASEWLYVASTMPKGAVYRVNLSGELPAAAELYSDNEALTAADGLVFAPDGQLLVAAFGGGKVVAVDPEDGGIVTVVSDGPSSALGGVASLAFGRGEGFNPYCVYATNMLLGGLYRICPAL